MFADDIVYRFLVEADINDVYNEGLSYTYSEPFLLVGKKIMKVEDSPVYLENDRAKINFDFPYKTFLLNDIDVSLENLPEINRGIIEYLGKTYEIKKITPKTFVAGVFLFYNFECAEKDIGYGA